MTEALAVHNVQALDRSATAAEIRAQVNLIQEVMKAVMKDGTHFGTIAGTDKPTLYKAGAEKILSTFRIGVDPVVEDLSTHDEAHYRVRARGFHQGAGTDLGWGVGEASSNEEKYRWREAICQAEWDETPDDRRRKKWKKGGSDGPYTVLQVRTNHADIANTVLKMAKKRAQIDLTLTVTAASDVFTQDIEDLPEDLREAVAGEAPAKPAMQAPQRKSAAAGANVIQGRIKHIDEKKGEKHGKPWTKWAAKLQDDKFYGTFDEKHHAVMVEARAASAEVVIEFKQTDYGRDIRTIAIVEAPAEPGAEG